jgi:hypothetical protein
MIEGLAVMVPVSTGPVLRDNPPRRRSQAVLDRRRVTMGGYLIHLSPLQAVRAKDLQAGLPVCAHCVLTPHAGAKPIPAHSAHRGTNQPVAGEKVESRPGGGQSRMDAPANEPAMIPDILPTPRHLPHAPDHCPGAGDGRVHHRCDRCREDEGPADLGASAQHYFRGTTLI